MVRLRRAIRIFSLNKSVPKGILYTCIATAILGLIYLVVLLSQVAGDVGTFLSTNGAVFGIFGQCMPITTGALGLASIVIINIFISGMTSNCDCENLLLSCKRQGIPFPHPFVHRWNFKKNPRLRSLVRFHNWFLPPTLSKLWSSTAFTAATSISAIEFQMSLEVENPNNVFVYLLILSTRRRQTCFRHPRLMLLPNWNSRDAIVPFILYHDDG